MIIKGDDIENEAQEPPGSGEFSFRASTWLRCATGDETVASHHSSAATVGLACFVMFFGGCQAHDAYRQSCLSFSCCVSRFGEGTT